jgi:hypothetical protein
MRSAIISLTVMICLSFPAITFSQAPDTIWTRIIGGDLNDYGYSVEQTNDGGFIIAGCTNSFGAGFDDCYIIKTDESGNITWSKTYGGSETERAYCVQQTQDNGYIVAGHTCSFGAGQCDVWLLKLNANGDTAWTKTYGGSNYDFSKSVMQLSDGGYIIAGHTGSYGAGSYDFYLIRTEASGEVIWENAYGGSQWDMAWSVDTTAEGGFITTGWTESFGAGGEDVYVVKTDADGDTLWTKVLGGTGDDDGREVQLTSDGGYIIVGSTESLYPGSRYIYLIKMDSSGDTLWTRAYGGPDGNWGYSVHQTTDNGYVIAGYTYSYTSLWDAYIVRTGLDGDTLWTRTFGWVDWDYAHSVRQIPGGGYIVTGWAEPYGPDYDYVWLLRLEADTDIDNRPDNSIIERFAIAQNYPNPFNAQTAINYDLPEASNVTINIYDILGRRVETLIQGKQPAGYHQIAWDATCQSSGLYFYRIQAGDYSETKKMALLK